MITIFRGSVWARSIARDPVTERVLLPFKFPGLSLLGWELRFHLITGVVVAGIGDPGRCLNPASTMPATATCIDSHLRRPTPLTAKNRSGTVAQIYAATCKSGPDHEMHTSLNSQVLVLNRLWQAVNICSARRAFALVYAG